MDPNEDSLLRFFHFIRSFQCERFPSDLLVRACEPKSTWSSSGEVVQRLPLEAGVPKWLVDIYNTNKPFFSGPAHGAHFGGMEVILENGVLYFEVAKARQPDHELSHISSIVNETSMAQERLSVFLQAFPSIHIEIIEEEIVDRLMDIAKRSILPLLSCVTDGDIKDWLLPKNHVDFKSHVFSLFEFLYQTIGILGIEHPLLPLSLPGRILNIVPHGTGNESMAALQRVVGIFKQLKANGQNPLECKPLSSEKVDERSHAILGYFLSLQHMHFADALTTWHPLLSKIPSQMEYLAAISFCDHSRLAFLERPAFLTLDTRVLEGLLRSRRKQHDQAAKVLEATRVEVVSQYGPCSMQLGIVTAELANCYNILRREALAESTLSRTLELRVDEDLSIRRDGIYLRLALADSFIGQAKYQEAVPILESVMGNPIISATFRMISALRLTKSRRRMHDDAKKAFEQNSPLWTGFALLSNVPEILVMEYVEELGCSISELPRRQLEHSKNAKRLIEAVNSVLCRRSSLGDSPCWEWYRNVQQEYLAQIEQGTKATKVKGKSEDLRKEHENELRTPPSSQASSRLPPSRDDDTSDDEGPWSERLVLSFDGMGCHALSSLIILKCIMHKIKELEIFHEGGSACSSRSSTYSRHEYGSPKVPEESDRVDEFLPCHYFDYMAGTSTAGLNSIMLGRLRMSVDQAIDNFKDFSFAVLGQPQTLLDMANNRHFSPVKTRNAFQNIIMSSNNFAHQYVSEREDTAQNEAFRENGGRRTRTMTVSYNGSTNREHIWRSYDGLHSKASESRSATIWEVALATSATPSFFSPMKANDATYWDGIVAENSPSYLALLEITEFHSKSPAVFVNLRSRPAMKAETKRRLEILARTLSWAHYPPKPLKQRISDINKLLQYFTTDSTTESESNQFRELAKSKGALTAYTLTTEGVLPRPWPIVLRSGSEKVKEALQQTAATTKHYLQQDEVRVVINRIAEEAVRIRRARAHANIEQWEDFVQ